jgi:hypothetical protein
MGIVDALCRELEDFRTPELPEDTGKPGWSKHFPCLFCGSDGKKTAAVNYRLGYYKCFRCNHDVSAGRYRDRVWISETREWADRIVPAGTDPVSRYRAQIAQAARTINAKLPGYAPHDDALSYARLRVLVYAGAPDINDADAGQLPAWEDKAQFDFNEVDRFVLAALNADLLNWADKRARQARREGEPVPLSDAAVQEFLSPDLQYDGKAFPTKRVKDAEPTGNLDGYPILRAVHQDGLSRADVARLLGISLATVDRRIRQERGRYELGRQRNIVSVANE